MNLGLLRSAVLAACFCVASISNAAAAPGARASAHADTATHPLPNPVPALLQAASLNEGFDNITQLPANGWSLQNLSSPVGSTNWFQGTNVAGGGPFDAYDGAANAYIGANYNNTGSTGTISNWLMTPPLDFGNSAAFTFFTRKVSPDTYADRLEVRLSVNGASTNAGSTSSTVGDFTALELSINPTLVLGVYPTAWTQFTISNLPHNGTGRLAFRYYVTGAGFSGTSSDYIGIDRVAYTAGAPEFLVGGTVSSLAGTGLTLQLNGGSAVPVSASGTFQFPTYITDGGAYAVTVGTQPSSLNQTCSVTNGSGVIGGADVSNVQVSCVTNTYTVGGSVGGLLGSGLTLQLNGANDLLVSSAGTFTFPSGLADGSNFAVTVLNQPGAPSQTCTVANGTGTLVGADVNNVAVSCTTNTYTVGGSVSGLSGSGLTLQLNGGASLSVPASGPFTFATPLNDGSAYTVTVLTQPTNPSQTCTVANGTGTLSGTNVVNVAVSCTTNTYTVGGSVSGLTGSGLTLQLNAQTLPISADGSFTFPTPLTDGTAYNVTIGGQPTNPNQTCSVANGSGTLGGANVTNVTVTCSTNSYHVGGTVSGLVGTGLTLQLGPETLPIASDGGFTFPTALADGSPYSVVVATQPSTPTQVCTVANGSGTLAGADVTNVSVTCATTTYTVDVTITGNGSLAPNGPQTVADGGTLVFTITPATNNILRSASGCGGTLVGTTYTTGPITGDCTITVIFGASAAAAFTEVPTLNGWALLTLALTMLAVVGLTRGARLDR
jgi:hypothetical protein